MGRKQQQRIDELERTLAGVTAERDALRTTAAAYQRRLRAAEAVKRPSLVEQAKRRVVELGDRVMGAVGL